jgi:hypothetical protein
MSNSMKTNLYSDEHVRNTCGPCYYQRQGYEIGLVVLCLSHCAGESPVGIPRADISRCGVVAGVLGLWAVF